MSLPRRAIVGVMGSGSESHRDRALRVGEWIARQGFHLLTGGGGGVMAAASEAFCGVAGRAGRALGVLPAAAGDPLCRPPPGYPNPWVEIAIATHLPYSGERGTDPLSRNHLNVLSSDALIALPGGAGTASEVRLALSYRRPLVAYLDAREQIAGLPAEARVESEFAAVCRFVADALDRRADAREPGPPG